MSLITRNNYEAYLLDYVEENLSPELVAELMLFLEKNPDLKEDLEAFDIHELIPLENVMIDKSILKKEAGLITISNYEEFIIAEIEGLNNKNTSEALHLFLANNTDKQKEFAVYEKTKLVAPVIGFENKKGLKKKSGILIPMYLWYSSAAAVIVILLLLNGFNNNERVYLPVANREEIKFKHESFDENVIKDIIILEEKQIATVEKPSLPIKKYIPLKNSSKEEGKGPSQLAGVPQENKIESDTSGIDIPQSKNEIIVEEDLYANVQITYEEEILDDGTPTPAKQKMTKLEIIRKATKQQFNQNVGKGREKLLLAFNAKPLNLFKKRKKN